MAKRDAKSRKVLGVRTVPKMRDVARESGVSESTVSHVLNGTKFVSEEVRGRVMAAVRELNYHRDSHAKRLATGKSNFLGLIISDIENPFFPGLIKGFEGAAVAAGYEVLLCTTNYDAVRTQDAFRKMIENKVPGVAVMTSRVDPAMGRYLSEQGVVSVFLDSDGPGAGKGNIRMDYRRGAREAVEHLYGMGHREFALVAGPQSRASHRSYREAVEGALKKVGLGARVIESSNSAASGEAVMRELGGVKSGGGNLGGGNLGGGRFPTAILCSNDVTALSMCRALVKAGLRVPEDVSVVGADDVPFAALTQPALTTVRMPREWLGALALETLRGMVGRSGEMGKEVGIETELVVRESTARVNRGRVNGAGRRK